MTARFTLRLASGEVVRDVNVHGAGGALAGSGASQLMRLLIERATAGVPLGRAFEPKPGHVRAYRSRAHSNEDERDLDLRGATLL